MTTATSTWPCSPQLRSTPWSLFELGLELGVQASRDVDLIDLRAVSTIMRKEIVSEGELVVAADAAACESFVADSLALYVALREEQLAALGESRRASAGG